jgi:hypothetical protein
VSVCVCQCVCLYLCVCLCVHICVYVCICVCMCKHVCVNATPKPSTRTKGCNWHTHYKILVQGGMSTRSHTWHAYILPVQSCTARCWTTVTWQTALSLKILAWQVGDVRVRVELFTCLTAHFTAGIPALQMDSGSFLWVWSMAWIKDFLNPLNSSFSLVHLYAHLNPPPRRVMRQLHKCLRYAHLCFDWHKNSLQVSHFFWLNLWGVHNTIHVLQTLAHKTDEFPGYTLPSSS